MTTTLLVFDIDGTLLSTPAGRWAFNRTFERFFGIPDSCATVPMAGRTDLLIYRDVCAAHRLDPEGFAEWREKYLGVLAEALVEDPGIVHPGVVALLKSARLEPGFALALGTGNIEEGARMKLDKHGLNEFFPCGGWGDDGDSRDDMIAAAVGRAAALQGRPFDRVVVIGDTPHDIACGQANRCITLGVATGRHSQDELAACGADVVLANFADTEHVVNLLRTLDIAKRTGA